MIVFAQDHVGKAVQIKVKGVSPSRRITLGVNSNRNNWDAIAAAKSLVSDFAGAVTSPVGTAAKWWGIGDEDTSNAYASTNAEILYGGGEAARNAKRAELSLPQMIGGFGFITNITLAYRDNVAGGGLTVQAGTELSLGTATISGVVFDAVCAGGLGESRHGIESVLEYYYHNRVSNADKNISVTTLKVGQTSLKAWVVGLSVQPMNLDYRLWSFELQLLVSPKWKLKPLDYRGNQSKNTLKSAMAKDFWGGKLGSSTAAYLANRVVSTFVGAFS